MADTAAHIRHALEYAQIADSLRDRSPAAAGEIIWLALVQAAQANSHRKNPEHHTQSRNGIRSVVGRLPTGNQERVRLLNITNMTVTNLHGLAYRPSEIEEPQHRVRISLARELVNALLHYA